MFNEKILITGATGFIGSHLAELCVEKGFNVVAFDRYNSNNDWGWLEDSAYRNEMDIILGDIRDFDSVSKAISECKAVIHLAALIGIPYSYLSPLAYIRTNIEGTYNVLEASKINDLDQILITSTSETYGSAKYVPMDESHPCLGQSPYSASKIAADQLSISYHKSFNLPIKIVRPFNTYGPRQSSRAIIPTIISQCLKKDKTLSLGNLKPTRDLTYVVDTCNGFLEILKSDNFLGEIINIGSNSEISINDLVHKIMNLMQVNLEINSEDMRVRPENSEVDRLKCENSKLKNNTNWKISFSLELGLKETISWIEKKGNYYKSDIYNV
tara:strand:+ start:135 stop:1115 length:981 start_codon:yes stop_codon:yes gene_type:complete